jgi:hypothetical protein
MDLQCGGGRTAYTVDTVSILVPQLEKLLQRFHSLVGSDNDRLCEKIQQGLPIARQAHPVEQFL